MTTATHGSSALTGTRTLFHRIVLTYRHSPALLLVTLAAPLGMVLLFGFVFGGALSGGDAAAYRAYLMPGVLVLVAAMGLATTAATANADLRSGLSDRFRTLPTAPVSVPAGLALAETATCAVALVPMVGVGYLVGWRIDAGVRETALAVMLLLFRFALSWLGIWLGFSIRDEQVLQQCAPMIFGTIMFSNIFVPTETMPAVIRTIAEWNPVSAVVAALRELLGGAAPTAVDAAVPMAADAAWPLQHPLFAAFGWCLGIVAVLVPLTVRRYVTTR
ncbi:ABC transporter permease [Rhodococcus sp. HM1]|uniref:ABC transporter permease n=1 Tax=unclassified Rhodococcus (in: high G+C Gram-positive bacteria) TaxID=192944 RepID=UPI0018CD84E4|nr:MULTISPECIES: ABC transporter permease [unclassified Rhodococcus (in: high G+C Gram-positive bacteria)]MBH0122220.1 ABC transporter permease [Rhodococcus sp. CX]MCK8669840.1 ABC transporter permease [Rhodococcus sp. HM1]